MDRELRLVLYNRGGAKCLPKPGWIGIDTAMKPQEVAATVLAVKDSVIAELQDTDGNRLDIHVFNVGDNRWSFRGVSSPPETAIWKAIATAKMRFSDWSTKAARNHEPRTSSSKSGRISRWAT